MIYPTLSYHPIYNRQSFVNSLPKRERIDLIIKIPGATPAAIDLLERILVFNPTARITAVEALKYEYFKEYQQRLSTDEEESNASVSDFDSKEPFGLHLHPFR